MLAVKAYQRLKTRKEHDKRRIRMLESTLEERDRRADTDKEMGRAVEESLLAHAEQLQRYVSAFVVHSAVTYASIPDRHVSHQFYIRSCFAQLLFQPSWSILS